MTRRDLDMLAQNLITAFTEQLHAIVSTNAAIPISRCWLTCRIRSRTLRRGLNPATQVPKIQMIGPHRYRCQAKGAVKKAKDPNSKTVLARERKKGNLSLKLKILEAIQTKRGLDSRIVSNDSWIRSGKRGRCCDFLGLAAQSSLLGLYKMISAKEGRKRPLCC